MPSRNKSGYQKFLHDFVNEVLVVCPNCASEAVVHSSLSSRNSRHEDIKVICTTCGYNKTQKEMESRVFYSKMENEYRSILFGAPVDPFFKLPLRLQENVNGNLFWAYNYEHLELLREIIEARLRERNGPNYNGSVASRLPRWLTSKSNRETVLKVIGKLKAL